jgi:hypothetical protein
MTKRSKPRAKMKQVQKSATDLIEDPLLEALLPHIVPVAKYTAIWIARLGAILLIPLRLLVGITWRAIAGFVQGVWDEVKVVRTEQNKSGFDT